MADEQESPDKKNERLRRMMHEAIDELFHRKIGKQSFGESMVVVVWKDGRANEVRIVDSASVR